MNRRAFLFGTVGAVAVVAGLPARDPDGWYGAVDKGGGLYAFAAPPGTYRDGDLIEFRYDHAADGKLSGVKWRVGK